MAQCEMIMEINVVNLELVRTMLKHSVALLQRIDESATECPLSVLKTAGALRNAIEAIIAGEIQEPHLESIISEKQSRR